MRIEPARTCGGRSRRVLAAALLGFLVTAGSSPLHAQSTPSAPGPAPEPEELRDRLTEREDENRLEQPFTLEVDGRPLTLSGEYEVALDFLDELVLGEPASRSDRLLIEQQLEAEAFYTFGPQLSLFAQVRVGTEHDLHRGTPDRISDFYVERGEMWLYSENIFGSGIDFEIGRLDFEDARLWWWDEDLDALRLTWEGERVELAIALASEVAPRRMDIDRIEPDSDDVQRIIVEGSWDWADNHSLELFALRQDDSSSRQNEGDVVRRGREDSSDADVTWFGLRAAGAWDLGRRGLFGYWVDGGWVRGDERVAEFEEESPGFSVVDESFTQGVRGWAFDAGATWIFSLPREPRVTLGYALGSGDRNPDDGVDRAFRQTGLEGNEIAFGGVERFSHYGVLLDPELSNLGVATLGVGVSLLQSSSLDLIYHRYRLREPSDTLRDARVELVLDEQHRELGDAVDLVFALEDDPRVQLALFASAFRPGAALATDRREWSYAGFLALRIAF